MEKYPLSVLVETQVPFSSMRVGMVLLDGSKIILECTGSAIRDPINGEFLAGMTTARDITSMAQQIREMRELEQNRFTVMLETMPQLVSLLVTPMPLDTPGKQLTDTSGMDMYIRRLCGFL